MLFLWLDDVRDPPNHIPKDGKANSYSGQRAALEYSDTWVWFRTGEALIDFLKDNWELVDTISFDHDLGEDVKTGYDVLCWMENEVFTDYTRLAPRMILHSANPTGRANMQRAIKSIWRFSARNRDGN